MILKKFITNTNLVLLLLFVLFPRPLLCQQQFKQNDGLTTSSDPGVVHTSVHDFSSREEHERWYLLSIHANPYRIQESLDKSSSATSDSTYRLGDNKKICGLDLITTALKESYDRHQVIHCGEARSDIRRRQRLEVTNIIAMPDEIIGYASRPQKIDSFIDFSILVKFHYYCFGCQGTGFELYEEYAPNLRDTYKVPFPSSSSLFQPDLFIKPCAPKQVDVINDFIDTATNQLDIPGLGSIHSMDMLRLGDDKDKKCSNEQEQQTSLFSSQFTLAFYGNKNIENLDDQMEIIKQTIMATYNELVVLNPLFCDAYSRIIKKVDIELYNGAHKIGYDFNLLGIRIIGTCDGCLYNGCLTRDQSGYATCKAVDGKPSSDSCYCIKGNNEEANYDLPTNEEFKLALEEHFTMLRDETSFTLVESILYLLETEVPKTCCGWPDFMNIPLESDQNLQEAVTDYLENGSSPYGYPINCWDVSRITNMNFAFYEQSEFNEPLICWDTSAVTDMSYMFDSAKKFNQDLTFWDTSNVVKMTSIFTRASVFNGDISQWDISNLESLYGLFGGATKFNRDITQWDTSNVKYSSHTFHDATSFNQDISQWNTGRVSVMSSMFSGASSFDQDISTWNTRNLFSMNYMFYRASSFNQDISNWDVSKAYYMDFLFWKATKFNQDLSNWNPNTANDMRGMFWEASSFKQDLCSWRFKTDGLNFENAGVAGVFLDSNCPNMTNPSQGIGPWCFTCTTD